MGHVGALPRFNPSFEIRDDIPPRHFDARHAGEVSILLLRFDVDVRQGRGRQVLSGFNPSFEILKYACVLVIEPSRVSILLLRFIYDEADVGRHRQVVGFQSFF